MKPAGRGELLFDAAVAIAVGLFVGYQGWSGLTGVVIAVGMFVVLWSAAIVPLRLLAVALVVSTLLTGGRFPFAGFNFLPEHVVLAAFGVALLLRSTPVLFRRPAPYEVLLLGWIGWNLAVTLAYSPDRTKSLAIVGWMALAWLTLWCIRGFFLADPDGRDQALRIGSRCAAVIGALSFVVWVVALRGGWQLGIQPEFNTGTLAAKGTALEANFLGTLQLCWLYLAIRARIDDKRSVSGWEMTGMVLGIVASMTRAVWLATILVVVGVAAADRLTRSRRQGRTPGSGLRPAAAAGLSVLVLVVVLASPAGQKVRLGLDFGSGTGGARVANWGLAWEDITASDAYLTGLGTNTFGQRHLSRTLEGEPDYLGNLALTVLYDSGVVGLFLFGAALASIIAAGRDPRARLLNLVILVALMIVGAATSPVWFGFMWLTVAALDTAPLAPSGPEANADARRASSFQNGGNRRRYPGLSATERSTAPVPSPLRGPQP